MLLLLLFYNPQASPHFYTFPKKRAYKRCQRLEIDSGCTHVARPMARFEWHLHRWQIPELMHLQCYTEWAPSFFQSNSFLSGPRWWQSHQTHQRSTKPIEHIKGKTAHGDIYNQGELYHHHSSSTFSKDLEGDLAEIAGQGKDDALSLDWIFGGFDPLISDEP